MDVPLLRAILICPHPQLQRGVTGRIGDSGMVMVLKTAGRYPDIAEAASLLRAHSAQVLFLDVASDPAAIRFGGELQQAVPGITVVALHYEMQHGEESQQLLLDLLHEGIRELLCHPFPDVQFRQAMARVARVVKDQRPAQQIRGEVTAFLPSKGGAGASTIAVNTALALARLDAGPVLLTDCDLNCGAVRFQLKIDHPFSVQDALDKANRLDDSIWPDLAVHAPQAPAGSLDLLASGPMLNRYPHPPAHAVSLIDFARTHYRRVLLDLSDSLDHLANDVLGQCQRIFLVVQPELFSVHLAREKLRFLKSLDVEDRVEVLVNHWRKNAVFSLSDIENILGLPIAQSFNLDPKSVYQALLSGTGVDPASVFGRDIEALAGVMAAADPQGSAHRESPGGGASGRKRRIEFFSVLPARYSLFPSKS